MKSFLIFLQAVVSCVDQSLNGSNAMAQVAYAGKVNAPIFRKASSWNTRPPHLPERPPCKKVLLTSGRSAASIACMSYLT